MEKRSKSPVMSLVMISRYFVSPDRSSKKVWKWPTALIFQLTGLTQKETVP